jgi:hypothetical protein
LIPNKKQKIFSPFLLPYLSTAFIPEGLQTYPAHSYFPNLPKTFFTPSCPLTLAAAPCFPMGCNPTSPFPICQLLVEKLFNPLSIKFSKYSIPY